MAVALTVVEERPKRSINTPFFIPVYVPELVSAVTAALDLACWCLSYYIIVQYLLLLQDSLGMRLLSDSVVKKPVAFNIINCHSRQLLLK